MKLENLLAERKSVIFKKWLDVLLESYPPDAQRFFRKEKSRFANPVGQTMATQMSDLYDGLLKGGDDAALSGCLDGIIRIRAVQDFKPSQAVAFILQLKEILRDALDRETVSNGMAAELAALEKRIDGTVLLAFDLYEQCRQKIYQIRVDECKRQVSGLLRRANLVCEIPEMDADPRPD
jgi:RsbT co-antagonist protein rsbRD N-terminal domain